MAHDSGEGFTGAEESASSASASPSPDAAGGVHDLAEAHDLGVKNSTASWSGNLAGGDGLIRQSTGDGMELGDAKNPVLDLSEAQDLGVKNSQCQGAKEGGIARAADFSKSSGGTVGFGQPRQGGTTPSNDKSAVLGQLDAQQHGAEGAMPEVARAPGEQPPSSFRLPSRRRKSLRPTRLHAPVPTLTGFFFESWKRSQKHSRGKESSMRASAANARSCVLDAYLTSQLNNALEATTEVVQNIRTDWILDEHASAAEPAGTSSGNNSSASAGQASALLSTSPTEPQEEPKEGSEDGGVASDATGPRSSRHLAILGTSLACAALMCVLFFIRRN